MREIILTGGEYIAIVDDVDFDVVSSLRWNPSVSGRTVYAKNTKFYQPGAYGSMHRLIMRAQPGQIVDHINGNGLDNRRENLRFTSALGNTHNSRSRSSVGLKGVYRHRNAWRARIFYKQHIGESLGQSKCAIEAALRYDEAAKRHYGEFAKLNFPAGVTLERMRELGVRQDIIDAYMRGRHE